MQDCWIRNTVGVQGVFEEGQVWSMILQPVLHTSTEEAREETCWWQIQFKHVSACCL